MFTMWLSSGSSASFPKPWETRPSGGSLCLVFCREAGFRPELPWTCCDYADMLLERNNEGDRAKPISLLYDSLSISIELGMRSVNRAPVGCPPCRAASLIWEISVILNWPTTGITS